jgi:hypothetical protein
MLSIRPGRRLSKSRRFKRPQSYYHDYLMNLNEKFYSSFQSFLPCEKLIFHCPSRVATSTPYVNSTWTLKIEITWTSHMILL